MKLLAFRKNRKRGEPPVERVYYTDIKEAQSTMYEIQKATGASVFVARIPVYYIEDIEHSDDSPSLPE